MVGVFESYAVALDGFHHLLYCFVLCDDGRLEVVSHVLQAQGLCLLHALYGYACHHGDNLLYLVDVDNGTSGLVAILPFVFEVLELLFELCLTVTVLCCELEVLFRHSVLLLLLDDGELLLQFDDAVGYLSIGKVGA